jgi:hypothetical protein
MSVALRLPLAGKMLYGRASFRRRRMYYFKGRGFLWHDTKGPVLWWPPNWFWFAVFEFKRWRAERAAERAGPGAGDAVGAPSAGAGTSSVTASPAAPAGGEAGKSGGA